MEPTRCLTSTTTRRNDQPSSSTEGAAAAATEASAKATDDASADADAVADCNTDADRGLYFESKRDDPNVPLWEGVRSARFRFVDQIGGDRDLAALTVEAAAMAKVPIAGTSWIPGQD